MHFIQRHILDSLTRAEYRRNSEMRPEGVESNLYQYHLKRMIAERYVAKTADGYTLAVKGLQYADKHSTHLKRLREQPKLVTILVIEDVEGRVALQPRPKQPFIGLPHLPSGKIHVGESLIDAAERELAEKLDMGTVTGALTLHATVHVTIRDQQTVISEFYGFVLRGTMAGTFPSSVTWHDRSQLEKTVVAPSVREVVGMLDRPAGSFGEFTIALS